LTQSLGADFADYGSSSRPTTDHTIFPDLHSFVSGLLRYTFAGQPGSPFSPPLITTPQASANSTIVSHNPAAGEKVIGDSAVNFQVK